MSSKLSYPTYILSQLDTTVAHEELPNENTTEVNITSDQINELEEYYTDILALAPTRVKEGGRGEDEDGVAFDITFNQGREVFIQHKAPDKSYSRGPHQNQKRDWLKFKIDSDQLTRLAIFYDWGEAFYAFPVVTGDESLNECLKRTVFVDAHRLFLRQFNSANTMVSNEISYILIESHGVVHPINQLKYFHSVGAFKTPNGEYKMKPNGTHHPYFDISLRNDIRAPGMGWNEFEKLLLDEDAGISVGGSKGPASDGGRPEYPDWFDVDIEGLSDKYIDRLVTRYATYRLAKSDTTDAAETFKQEIVDQLFDRMRRGMDEDLEQIPEPDDVQTEDRPSELDDGDDPRKTFLDKKINSVARSRNPLTGGLSDSGRFRVFKKELKDLPDISERFPN